MKQASVTVCAFAITAATGVYAPETVLEGADAFGGWKDDKPGTDDSGVGQHS